MHYSQRRIILKTLLKMKKNFLITEEEKKSILSKYYGEKVVLEQEKTMSEKIYGLIKNLPLVKKIEKSYDPDIKQHILNLVKISPKLKNKEKELLSQVKDEGQSSEELAKKLNSEISNLNQSKLNEQAAGGVYAGHYLSQIPLGPASTIPAGWMITIPTLIFLILFIRKVIKDMRT